MKVLQSTKVCRKKNTGKCIECVSSCDSDIGDEMCLDYSSERLDLVPWCATLK